jgi:SH3-like domain-containing protein
MMLLKSVLLTFILLVMGVFSVFAGTKVRVTGDNVNLRAKPLPEAEVVSQVNEGAVLVAEDYPGPEWVKIVPPEEVDLWVYSELVRDEAIAVSKVRVRAGPGINYSSVGFLTKGEKVTVRGTMGEWSKIRPPAGSFLYISGDYVERFVEEDVERERIVPPTASRETDYVLPPEAVDRTAPVVEEERPSVSRLPSIRVPDRVPEKAPLPGILADETLVASKPQGEVVRYEGVLRPAGLVWRRPSKFRLVKHDDNGRAITVCYVLGRQSGLEKAVGAAVVISGREYWIQGVRAPVVVPDKVTPGR